VRYGLPLLVLFGDAYDTAVVILILRPCHYQALQESRAANIIIVKTLTGG
jgi:hypothetical protein